MLKVNSPQDPAEQVFLTCISRVKKKQLKSRLLRVRKLIAKEAVDFASSAANNTLHTLTPKTNVGCVTRDEMANVYSMQMARKRGPGRHFYDSLIAAAPHGRCPLCGHRLVTTLDHHLPKAHFPALAVAPMNLVPACSDCNKSKMATIPSSPSDGMLHPYFDDIDKEQWLRAQIIEGSPAAIRYRVVPPLCWSAILASRVRKHFDTLKLGNLYAAEAADELLNIRHQLNILYNAGGEDAVRRDLVDKAASARAARRNGWRTAVFDAFASSDWFCDGGFL
jgi:hypothetical protein